MPPSMRGDPSGRASSRALSQEPAARDDATGAQGKASGAYGLACPESPEVKRDALTQRLFFADQFWWATGCEAFASRLFGRRKPFPAQALHEAWRRFGDLDEHDHR